MSDLPIILVAVLLVNRLPPTAIGWLGIAGGLFVIYLGVESMRAHPVLPDADAASAERAPWQVLTDAVLTQPVEPTPLPLLGHCGCAAAVRALAGGVADLALFLLGFYALLVGQAAGGTGRQPQPWLAGQPWLPARAARQRRAAGRAGFAAAAR